MAVIASTAIAEPQIWLNPGIYAFHFDRDKDLRDDNIGFGVEVVVAPDHAVGAGSYVNGNRTRLRYAAYAWRPLHWRPSGADVLLGVVAGAFDGTPTIGTAAGSLRRCRCSIEGRRLGVNLSVIPTIRDRVDGAIAIQLKLRVW